MFYTTGNRLAQSETSGTGVIPKAKIKTIRMTFVIVLGKKLDSSRAS